MSNLCLGQQKRLEEDIKRIAGEGILNAIRPGGGYTGVPIPPPGDKNIKSTVVDPET